MRPSKNWLPAAALLALTTLTQCFTGPSEGEQLYAQRCASCHMDDGSGLRSLIPPIAGSDYLVGHRDQLICLIKSGHQGEMLVNGVRYNRPMPGNEDLEAVQIANILNYIQRHFGNQNETFTVQEVNSTLPTCGPAVRQ